MFRKRLGLTVGLALGLTSILLCNSATAQTTYVAGLAPEHRPDEAPKVVSVETSEKEAEHRLFGIVRPIPGNLASIAASGRWFVPLRSPGMNAPYDLRGWHAQTKVTANLAAASASQ